MKWASMRAGEDGNTGKVQFAEIPGPAYVSAEVPGRGIRPRNAFALKNGVGTVPNIGPIKGASAYGAPQLFYTLNVCGAFLIALEGVFLSGINLLNPSKSCP